MTPHTIIANGTVISEGVAVTADLAIDDGRVVALGRGLGSASHVIDAVDCFVMPGVIDPHVHVAVPEDPNMDPIIEDLPVAMRTALLGGTTTVCSYVRGVPGRSVRDSIAGEIELGLDSGCVDFALNLLCTPGENPRELVAVGKEYGITTFKAMLAYRTRGLMLTDQEVLELADSTAAVDGVLLVHAENGVATEYLEERERRSGSIAREAYLATSPGRLEAEGAHRAAVLASLVGCRLILVHMSAKESLEMARMIARGLDRGVTWETQPHYLLLTNEAVLERDALAKVGPPLREAEDVDAIRHAVMTGVVSHLSSDHAPRTREMKLAGSNILDAPYGGTSGTELLLRLAYEHLWRSGLVSIERLVDLVSTNAARAYGLFPKKGTLRAGADADIVVMPRDFSPLQVRSEDLHGLSDYSLYEGLSCAPPPRYVLRHGKIVAEDGSIVASMVANYLTKT